MKLPLPKFKKGTSYVAGRRGGVTYVTCMMVTPCIALRPDHSTFGLPLDHFNWVIDIPADQQMPTRLLAKGTDNDE